MSIDLITCKTRYAFTQQEVHKIWKDVTDPLFFKDVCILTNEFLNYKAKEDRDSAQELYEKIIAMIVEKGYTPGQADVMLKFAFPEIVHSPHGGW